MCKIGIRRRKGQASCSFRLDFLVFRDGGNYIAYCPSLDLSAYGSTRREAVADFREVFSLYFECCMEHGTLHDDLVAHGWKLGDGRMEPPSLVSLARKPAVKSLFDNGTEFRRVAADTTAPAFR